MQFRNLEAIMMGNQELIIEYIKGYISNEAGLNSAVMIKGVWGCGKTYFVKEILSSKLKYLLDEEKKHLCYISLNGISSIKDFMKRIQSVIIKTNLNIKRIEPSSYDIDIITGLDSIFDEINLQGWVNLAFGAKRKLENRFTKNNIGASVFVFDDLERCAIPLKEILGAINDLIEHMNCKCIIIANEDEINKEQDFKKIKEKFISRTIEFKPDIEDFFSTQRRKYKSQPLGRLNDKNWEAFIKTKSYSADINLRTVQSALSTTNEIIKICQEELFKEDDSIVQYILNKLLNDVYHVEEFYKKGNPRPQNQEDGEVLGLYDLNDFGSILFGHEIFNFVFQVIYDGEYDDDIVKKHISNCIQNIKIRDVLSPITELKDYFFLEDEEIQDKLDKIELNIKKINLKQACDLFNFLIPLLDLGFKYHNSSDFDVVLDHILKDMDIYESENSLLYSVVEHHTILKDKQLDRFILALKKVKEKLNTPSVTPEIKNIETLLTGDNWLGKLQNDIKNEENNYRKGKKYLAYFDQNMLLNKIEQSSNKELVKFRDLLLRMYSRENCLESFENDIESVYELIRKLEGINITRKINKATIKYIIGDLKVSFPKNE